MKIKSYLQRFTLRNEATKGFTLIELLIVIAILGVLAAGLLVALDPVEQIKRAADAGTKSTAVEVSRAYDRYYANTANSGTASYPITGDTIQSLKDAGELKSSVNTTGVSYAVAGSTGATKPWTCFAFTSKAFKLEANAKYSNAGSAAAAPATTCNNPGTASSTCTYWCTQ